MQMKTIILKRGFITLPAAPRRKLKVDLKLEGMCTAAKAQAKREMAREYYVDLNAFRHWLRREEHPETCTKLTRLIESGKVRAAHAERILLRAERAGPENLVWLRIDARGYAEALKTQAEKVLDHIDALHRNDDDIRQAFSRESLPL